MEQQDRVLEANGKHIIGKMGTVKESASLTEFDETESIVESHEM